MEKVSIIIPVYNVAGYINDSIHSALNQSYPNIEYIIVDDCGSDDSIDIAKKIALDNPNKDVKIIYHDQNRGLSAARNTGIDNASGEYVFFLDSDDTISKDCIEEHLKAIKMYDADFTDSNIKVLGGRNIFTSFNKITEITANNILNNCFNGGIHISAWNKLYKKSFLDKHNLRFVEGLIHEDNVWIIDVARCATSAVVIPNYTYFYYIREGSITTTVSSNNVIRRYDSWLYILKYIVDLAEKCNDPVLLSNISSWLSNIRFRICTRLVSMKIGDELQREYYNKINSAENRLYSSGLYSLFCRLPFVVFKLMFATIYNMYSNVKQYL